MLPLRVIIIIFEAAIHNDHSVLVRCGDDVYWIQRRQDSSLDRGRDPFWARRGRGTIKAAPVHALNFTEVLLRERATDIDVSAERGADRNEPRDNQSRKHKDERDSLDHLVHRCCHRRALSASFEGSFLQNKRFTMNIQLTIHAAVSA